MNEKKIEEYKIFIQNNMYNQEILFSKLPEIYEFLYKEYSNQSWDIIANLISTISNHIALFWPGWVYQQKNLSPSEQNKNLKFAQDFLLLGLNAVKNMRNDQKTATILADLAELANRSSNFSVIPQYAIEIEYLNLNEDALDGWAYKLRQYGNTAVTFTQDTNVPYQLFLLSNKFYLGLPNADRQIAGNMYRLGYLSKVNENIDESKKYYYETINYGIKSNYYDIIIQAAIDLINIFLEENNYKQAKNVYKQVQDYLQLSQDSELVSQLETLSTNF